LRKHAKEVYRAEGKAEGIALGKAEAEAEKKEIVQRMFALGMKLDVIADLYGFSTEELEALKK
jgi:predicted transposase/invertase (TIGR01784 family)